MTNQSQIQGKWKEIKGDIQKKWADLTGDELDKTKGNMTAIAGIIQGKYGAKKEEVSNHLKDIVGRYEQKAAQASENIKNKLKNNKDKQ